MRTLNGNATQVQVFDGIAYAAMNGELRAYDLVTGERLLETIPSSGHPITGLARERSMLYAMDAGKLLRAIDISSGQMALRGSLTMPAGGGNLYVAGGGCFQSR
jgi:hypothetical protein